MLTSKIYGLCKHSDSVASELAKDPSQDPEHVFKKLYEHPDVAHLEKGSSENIPSEETSEFDKKNDLEKAYASGDWGSTNPSDLFLQV